MIVFPISLNKSLFWKKVEKENFKIRWRERKKFIKKTKCFQMNPSFLKSGLEITTFFKNLIEITPNKQNEYLSGNSFLKFGGIFTFFNEREDCYIKFILAPTKKLSIQIIDNSLKVSTQKFSEYLLNVLEFLFSV